MGKQRAPDDVPEPVALAEITAPVKRGGRTLQVSSTGNLKRGDIVELSMTNPSDGSLFKHFYNNRTTVNMPEFQSRQIVSFVSQVAQVHG